MAETNQKGTLTVKGRTALSKEEVQNELALCLNDMKEVEKELDAHLQLLGDKVDKGFAQIQKLNSESLKAADELSKMGHPKVGMVVAVAGVAISGVMGAINEMEAASAHNAALQKLMEQKVKIAREKISSMIALKPKALRPYLKLQKLLKKELEQKYSDHDLMENPESLEGIIGNIARVMEIYKTSRYNIMTIDYLIAEYKAWLNYNQKSDLMRPIMCHVNNELYYDLFCDDKSYNLNITMTRTGANGKISGAELMFLSSPSLSSCLFYDCVKNNDCVQDIEVEPVGIAETLLKKNEAYKEYKSSLDDTNRWWCGPFLAAVACIVVSIAFDYFCFDWIENWWAFFRWIAKIVIVGIELLIVGVVAFDKDEKEIKKEICEKASQKQLDLMEYVEIYQPDLEEKSVFAAGVKGLFKGVFG